MRAQIAHQRQRVAIAHPHPVHVHDNEGETGAGQQVAHRARVQRRMDPRRRSAPQLVGRQQGGAKTTPFQHGVYYVALLSAAVSTVLLIAPAAQHRVLFRQRDKEILLRRSSRSA